MTAIACNDFITRSKIHKNINRTFSDKKYAPLPSERGYEVIQKKRQVARWYLFELPHLPKEAGCVLGCATALGVSVYGYVENRNLDTVAYVTLIATLIVNELITLWWRMRRYQRLKQIDDEQRAAP